MCFPSQYCCPWAKPCSGFSIGGQVLRPKFERRNENEFEAYIDKDQAKFILVLDLRVCYCPHVLMIRIRSSYFSPKPKGSSLISEKKNVQWNRLHEGCIPLQLPEGRHTLVDGPIKRYPGLQIYDTDSPVQYREPSLRPFSGELGSPQLTKAWEKQWT